MGEEREDKAGAQRDHPGTSEAADVDDKTGERRGSTPSTDHRLHAGRR